MKNGEENSLTSGSEDDEEDDDWEEVPSLPESVEAHKKEISDRIPSEGLVITIPQTGGLHRKLVKKKHDPNEELRLHLNRKVRSRQEILHKVSLLCCLSRIFKLNQLLRNEELRALALSMWGSGKNPCSILDPPTPLNRTFLQKGFNWIRTTFFITSSPSSSSTSNVNLPYPKMKAAAIGLVPVQNYDDNESLEHLENILKCYLYDKSSRKDLNMLHRVLLTVVLLRELGYDVRLMNSLQPDSLRPLSNDLLKKPKTDKEEEEDEDKAVVGEGETSKSSKNKNSKTVISKDNKKGKKSETNVNTKNISKSSKSKKGKKMISSDSEEEDEDYGKKNTSRRKTPSKNKKKKDSANINKSNIFGCDYWLEVYLPKERLWVSLDVQTGQQGKDIEFEAKASKPMLYVVGIDNEGSVKDLTRRYVNKWLTSVIGKRVDSDWWEQTLEPYRTFATNRDEAEDKLLDELVLAKSHPENLNDLQGHPLYTAARFLKKFEAIYPPNAHPEGQVKLVPYFSRNVVKTLHSRELWFKSAKVVKQNEIPYKTVKARPKFTRDSGTWMSVPNDKPLELFGEWQVEEYKPPAAKDGKVPRSEYGNVELYKPEMLPKGTVHLVLPGLNKVAKKLGIDCAPALIDFEFSGVGSHPVFDGFVVCEEFKEVLLDAWNQEQDQQEIKMEEKRRARVYGNWRKLIRGVMIKLRLAKRYPLDGSTPISNHLSSEQPSCSKNLKKQATTKKTITKKRKPEPEEYVPPPRKRGRRSSIK